MIDSINLRSDYMEAILIHDEDFILETVKSSTVFEHKVWKSAFKKPLTKNIKEAKIVHNDTGVKLPLKTFYITPKSQTLEFAGLYGYNERSELLVYLLQRLDGQLQNTYVSRVDIAIDYHGMIPKKILKKLLQTRTPKQVGNTTYWKTKKEGKTNPVMDIKIYNKALKEKLDYPMMRLEFVFKSEYLKKLHFKDLETVFKKMENTIKRATGLNVKIQGIDSLPCVRVS